MTIQIWRFSEDGFIPKRQTYWQNLLLQQHQSTQTINLSLLNDYQKKLVQKQIELFIQSYTDDVFDDFQLGFWVFVQEKPTERWQKHFLNHLAQHDYSKRKWFSTFLPNREVYTIDGIIPIKQQLDKLLPGMECYIPTVPN